MWLVFIVGFNNGNYALVFDICTCPKRPVVSDTSGRFGHKRSFRTQFCGRFGHNFAVVSDKISRSFRTKSRGRFGQNLAVISDTSKTKCLLLVKSIAFILIPSISLSIHIIFHRKRIYIS